ncbi:MAG: polynucleotide kinase-phosphatase [Rhodobacteraceae bacterium]|nr:polynucleotide kinase-phosphatase [Paracoccaceae bacterium]
MKITIPDFALVILIGPTGAGKSSFALKHFLPTEIVSSDACRAIVSDDETDQSATRDAFDLLEHTAGLRLKRRKLTVIDATSVQPRDRARWVALARRWHALPLALALDIDPELCQQRNQDRPNRQFGSHVARNQSRALRQGLKRLAREGFRQVQLMKTPEEVAALEISREPLWTDRRGEVGPFDIIGDIHGCWDELTALLDKLGYQRDPYTEGEALLSARHPEGRRAAFVGDITDRGPRNLDCLRLVMGMCAEGAGFCVMGNHDHKLARWLKGRNVKLTHGLDLTAAELEAVSESFRKQAHDFLDNLRSHAWLAGGGLVIAHAGLKEEMHGRGSGEVRSFAMFGETTGEVDEFGLPVRLDWAKAYQGKAEVIYGHTPTLEAEWLNNTLCIDTGCVFGGKLTALRWPEREVVQIPAARVYVEPKRPLGADTTRSAQQEHDRLLYFDDFAQKLRIESRFGGAILIPEENALAALEVMSRFAVDPRWLIHLPPTMAACPTAPEGPFLERPEQALAFYAKRGATTLVAEEKHMGSRALIVVCRNVAAAEKRFGTEDGKAGVVYTRTGRPFFRKEAQETELISRLRDAAYRAGLWEELNTDWLLLDTEIMPWSAKAQELLQSQYLPTAAAAKASAEALMAAIGEDGPPELAELRVAAARKGANSAALQKTINGYCWVAESLDDHLVAPFHLLAAEGAVFSDRDHSWHMQTLARLCEGDPILLATRWRVLDAEDANAQADLTAWWEAHTGVGGEGMVIKPIRFLAQGNRHFLQPAMKVRGRDYLRLIYGPDYDLPENIERLRQRNLGRKFSLAEREFKLGLEGLHRFVERAPLRRVHECALGVLGLESEPVDPRL